MTTDESSARRMWIGSQGSSSTLFCCSIVGPCSKLYCLISVVVVEGRRCSRHFDLDVHFMTDAGSSEEVTDWSIIFYSMHLIEAKWV